MFKHSQSSCLASIEIFQLIKRALGQGILAFNLSKLCGTKHGTQVALLLQGTHLRHAQPLLTCFAHYVLLLGLFRTSTLLMFSDSTFDLQDVVADRDGANHVCLSSSQSTTPNGQGYTMGNLVPSTHSRSVDHATHAPQLNTSGECHLVCLLRVCLACTWALHRMHSLQTPSAARH